MSDVRQWSPNAIDNSSTPPHGAPERGVTMGQISDIFREVMAAVRRWDLATSGIKTASNQTTHLSVLFENAYESGLVNGDRICFRTPATLPNVANLSVSVNGLPPLPVYDHLGTHIPISKIQPNYFLDLIYNSSSNHFVLCNPLVPANIVESFPPNLSISNSITAPNISATTLLQGAAASISGNLSGNTASFSGNVSVLRMDSVGGYKYYGTYLPVQTSTVYGPIPMTNGGTIYLNHGLSTPPSRNRISWQIKNVSGTTKNGYAPDELADSFWIKESTSFGISVASITTTQIIFQIGGSGPVVMNRPGGGIVGASVADWQLVVTVDHS